MSTPNATINQYPLSLHDVSRLAPASLDVLQRNSDKPELAAHATTMVPIANGVLIAMQELDTLKVQQVKLLAESEEQTGLLHGLMLRRSGILVHDLEGFDIGAFERKPHLKFDVAQKAMSLKHLVETEGAGLPYRDALLAELTARIESADGAERAAYTARVALQEKQREVRELVVSFHKELVGLRRTVRWTLGSTHVDYRRLRVPSRAADEPPVADAPSVEPSATGSEAASPLPSDGASGPRSTR